MPVGMRRDGYETLKRLEKDDNDDNDDKVEVDDSCMIQDWKWVIIVLNVEQYERSTKMVNRVSTNCSTCIVMQTKRTNKNKLTEYRGESTL
ncbi:hypothetical protein BLOT_015336 [Blomia tropicalis]|nr:hypothetical protein BLOT_015336 [Blomia tropicalis]